MYRITIILILTTLNPCWCEFDWTNQVELCPEIKLSWSIKDPDYLVGEVVAKNVSGYVGIGFSLTGGMAGSDIILAWIDDQGKIQLQDYYGTANAAPTLDTQQDVELVRSAQSDNEFSFIFRRKWNTCDKDDFPIGEDTARVIWAWSNQRIVEGKSLSWHEGNRGAQSVNMRHQIAAARRQPEKNEKYWDVKFENYKVTHEQSQYNCRMFKFPKLNKKHHIIGYVPIIEDETKLFVHHVALYKCKVPPSENRKAREVFEPFLKRPDARCYTNEVPDEWLRYCWAFEAVITLGSQGEIYPAEAGSPIGEDLEDDAYFILETHHDNPTNRSFTHTVGVRMIYTENLRPFDMDILFFGNRITPFQLIPPKIKDFKVRGFCPGQCTKRGLPETGIKIVSVLLHGHIYVKSIVLRHIRDGVELPPISQDKYYDFNYQQYRRVPKEVTVLPGDELIVDCVYDNPNATFVVGGISTHREMCEAFVNFYPKSSLVDCRSQIEFESFFRPLGIQGVDGEILNTLHLPYSPETLGLNVSAPDDALIIYSLTEKEDLSFTLFNSIYSIDRGQNQSVSSLLYDIDWGNKQSELNKAWLEGDYYVHCGAQAGRRIDPGYHIQSPPKFVPYPEEELCGNLENETNEPPFWLPVTKIFGIAVILIVLGFGGYHFYKRNNSRRRNSARFDQCPVSA